MSLIVSMLVAGFAARAEVVLGVEVPSYATSVQFVQDEMYEEGYTVGVIYPVSQAGEIVERSAFCRGPFAVDVTVRTNALTLEFDANPRGLNKLVSQLKGESEWTCRAVVLDGTVLRGPIQCRGKTDADKTLELKPAPRAKPTCVS